MPLAVIVDAGRPVYTPARRRRGARWQGEWHPTAHPGGCSAPCLCAALLSVPHVERVYAVIRRLTAAVRTQARLHGLNRLAHPPPQLMHGRHGQLSGHRGACLESGLPHGDFGRRERAGSSKLCVRYPLSIRSAHRALSSAQRWLQQTPFDQLCPPTAPSLDARKGNKIDYI